jgi:hypothetical protein
MKKVWTLEGVDARLKAAAGRTEKILIKNLFVC